MTVLCLSEFYHSGQMDDTFSSFSQNIGFDICKLSPYEIIVIITMTLLYIIY